MWNRYCLALLAAGLVGCSEAPTTSPEPPGVGAEELAAARESKDILGEIYVLEAALWRDFMPVSPPDGKPLIASIRVIERDSDTFSPEVDAVHLWVVNGSEIWSTPFTDEPRPPGPPNEIQKVARDGPKWGPGIAVDVVVALSDASGGLHLVAKRDQPIFRTD